MGLVLCMFCFVMGCQMEQGIECGRWNATRMIMAEGKAMSRYHSSEQGRQVDIHHICGQNDSLGMMWNNTYHIPKQVLYKI